MGVEQVKHGLGRCFFNLARISLLLCFSGIFGGCTLINFYTKPVTAPRLESVRKPVKAQEYFSRGQKLGENGDHENAVKAYRKATKADPRFGLAYLEWANSLLFISEDQNAIGEVLKRAVRLLPNNPRAQMYYGQVLARLDRESEAFLYWEKALALRPSLIEPRIDLAEALERKGQIAKAKGQLEKVISMKPSHVQARMRLGQLLARQQQFLAAARQIEIAAKQTKRSAALYRRAAHFYASAGEMEEASRLRLEADKIDPPAMGRKLRPLRKARPYNGL